MKRVEVGVPASSASAPATTEELGLMRGSPPTPGKLVTLRNWQEGPHNRWGFQHVSELVPSAVLSRGDGDVLELRSSHTNLDELLLPELRSGHATLGSFLDGTATDGLIVLRGTSIVYERYLNGMDRGTRHVLMSISKSLCGLLTGHFVESGVVALDGRASEYVPELWESAYGEATVSQLLDMTASVEFNEDYADQRSHVQAQDRVAGWRPRGLEDPSDGYAFLKSIRGGTGHGQQFQYCSATTDVLAWVLERATGRRYTELLADHLWSRLGAEHDAFVTVDTSGFAFANGGVCTSLRDLARVGLLVLRGGGIGSHRIASDAWVVRTRAGGDPAHARGSDFGKAYPRGSYRNQWWVTEGGGCLYGAGIFGQFLWLDPEADIVIAKFSSLPEALDYDVVRDHHAMFRSVVAALR